MCERLCPGPLPPDVHLITAASHDQLLPLVPAAIHHGGEGTTAASLRAGLPNTVPFLGGQPFWGRRVEYLGVGPAALDRKTLSVESISAALVAMDDPAMRRKADALGSAIRDEDGLGAAIRFLRRGRSVNPTRWRSIVHMTARPAAQERHQSLSLLPHRG